MYRTCGHNTGRSGNDTRTAPRTAARALNAVLQNDLIIRVSAQHQLEILHIEPNRNQTQSQDCKENPQENHRDIFRHCRGQGDVQGTDESKNHSNESCLVQKSTLQNFCRVLAIDFFQKIAGRIGHINATAKSLSTTSHLFDRIFVYRKNLIQKATGSYIEKISFKSPARSSTELLVRHAEALGQDILRARKDQDLGIRARRAENAGIQGQLDVDIINARVVGAARRVQALGSLGVGPRVDKVRKIIVGVVLIILDATEEDARARLHTRRIVKLDLDIADGIEELARRLVHGTRKVKLVAIRVALGAHNEDVFGNRIVKLEADIVADARRIFRSAGRRVLGLRRNDLRLVENLDKALVDEEITLGILEIDLVGLDLARQVGIRERCKRERAIGKALVELLVRKTIRTNVDLRTCGIDDGVVAAGKVNLIRGRVESHGSEGERQL